MATPTIDAQARHPALTRTRSDHTNRRWAIGWIIAVISLWAFYKFALDSLPDQVQDLVKQWLPLTAVNEAIVWVICAVGLNIVVGYAGLLDLGFVAFWAIGGYCAGWFMSNFFYQVNVHFLSAAHPEAAGIHINWWLVLVMAGSICAFFGILIGAPTLRLKSDYLAIVTLGFGEIIPQIFTNGEDINGFNLSNGTKGITPLDPIAVRSRLPQPSGPFDLGTKFLLFSLVTAFCVFVSLRIREGRLGRAWLAIREDELAASHDGRAADALQAVRLRGRRLHGRPRRCGLRDPCQRRVRRPVQLLDLHHPARDGRPRRHGQRLGRHDRGARPRVDQLHVHAAARVRRSTTSSARRSTSRPTTS